LRLTARRCTQTAAAVLADDLDEYMKAKPVKPADEGAAA
jgi:hypothetical protein